MNWANFLHIYQPAVQKPEIIKRIASEAYARIFSGLLDIERCRLTLNISGVLCDLLEKNGRQDILKQIRELVEKGNVELVGSAKYHAFLPLLPEKEIERQIILNEETLNKHFGKNWKKGGFFPPEMAYSKKVAEVAKRLGYKWIIIDEMAFPDGRKANKDVVYEIDGLDGFAVFFRQRKLSFKILSASAESSMPGILRTLEGEAGEENTYALTAMDGEIFGHHRPGLERLLFDLMKEEKIKPLTISEVLLNFTKRETIEPRPSTWAAVPRDFKIGQPYFRWNNRDNEIQQWQWRLLNLALESADKNDAVIRKYLDQTLASDQFWWSSARPWWSLEWIERGAHDLKEIIKNSKTAKKEEKETAEELYKNIVFTAFSWQRTGLVDELSRGENEEIRQRLEEKEKFFMSREEYEEMIKAMEERMRESARRDDYHQAAMIQDRIAELKVEMEKGAPRKEANDLMF